jgi:hypothetical protein
VFSNCTAKDLAACSSAANALIAFLENATIAVAAKTLLNVLPNCCADLSNSDI